MKEKGKKSNIIKELANAYDQKNKKRNCMMIITIALAVMLLISVLSIATGKLELDTLKNVRKAGTTASVYLTNAKEDQYKLIKQLSYIKSLGWKYQFGTWYDEDEDEFCTCAVLDKDGYNAFIKPAYTDIVGSYPEKKNEIMLSTTELKKLGITNPKVGMTITPIITLLDWMNHQNWEEEAPFILSGYYTDHMEKSTRNPVAYFSQAYLEELKDNKIAFKSNILIEYKSGYVSGIQMEEQLYDVIELDANQKFVAVDSASYQAMEQLAGGYGVALLLGFIILLSMYLLIYNVLLISTTREIPQYGLLFTIGATVKQIKKMIYLQSVRRIYKGVLLGISIGVLFVFFLFPMLLNQLYLEGVGNVEQVIKFNNVIFIGSVVFVILVTLIATKSVIRQVGILNPVAMSKYVETSVVKKVKEKKTKNGSHLYQMAWRNIIRTKRKFIMTICSLFLGCLIALCADVISKGTDILLELQENPDFEIGINYKFIVEDIEEDTIGEKDYDYLNEAFLTKILNIEGINNQSVKRIWGTYGWIDFHGKLFSFRNFSITDTSKINCFATIQVVEDSYIDELEAYVNKYHLKADKESFRNGTGIIFLHKHELSEQLQTKADKTIGEVERIGSVAFVDGVGVNNVDYSYSGYLDTTKKQFPKLDTAWSGEGINYFIVSEAGFKRSNFLKQTFRISFDVESDQEAEIKSELKEIVNEGNLAEEKGTPYYIIANSDKINTAQTYIKISRIFMGALSDVLLFMGIMNFMNTMTTGVITRKKEFAVMESIGMTKKQLKRMLVWEGSYYCLCVLLLLGTVGSAVMWGVGKVIKMNVSYFKFIYPFRMLGFIVLVLSIMSVVIPRMIYRKEMKSAIHNLLH